MTDNTADDMERRVLPLIAKSVIPITTSITRSALSVHLARIRVVKREAAIEERALTPSPLLPLD